MSRIHGRISFAVPTSLSFLLLSPYVQHAFYHTTLFNAFGQTGEDLFVVFLLASLATVVGIVALSDVAHSLLLQKTTYIVFTLACFLSTGYLMIAQVFDAAYRVPMVIVASILYGVCLVVCIANSASQAFVLRSKTGDSIAVTAPAVGMAIGLVVFAWYPSFPYYRLAAGVSLGMCAVCQLFFHVRQSQPNRMTLTSDFTRVESHSMRSERAIILSGCIAVTLLSSLLYVSDPDIEYLADQPFPLVFSFVLMVLIAIGSYRCVKGTSDTARLRRLLYLSTVVLVACLMLTSILMMVFEVGSFCFEFSAGCAMAIQRIMGVPFIMAALVISPTAAGALRTASVYMAMLYYIPCAIKYSIIPRILSGGGLSLQSAVTFSVLGVCLILVTAMVVAIAANSPVSPQQRAMAPDRSEVCQTLAEMYGLTARETEILLQMSLGHTGKKIAENLGIAPGTVNSHVKRLYPKLAVNSRQELIDLVDEEMERRSHHDDATASRLNAI